MNTEKNYKKITDRLKKYCRCELIDDANGDNNLNKNAIKLKPFKYKTSIIGSSIDYVAEKSTNAKGNEIDNPDYDTNKIVTKEGS